MHTHAVGRTAGAVRILNNRSGFADSVGMPPVSMGLHPWYLTEGQLEKNLGDLEAAASQSGVMAIGECGLDRVCDTPMPLQEKAFRCQLSLAEGLRKPVIVHCVRAYEDVLRILREERVSIPVIFHGFRRDAALAGRILASGHRLSFGRHLSQPKVAEVFRSIPPERVFLETDDTEASIADVYALAAVATGFDLPALADGLWAHAVSVFGQDLNKHG